MISKRRIYWALVAALLVLAIALIVPIRSRVTHFLIASWCPDLSFGDWTVHEEETIVELQDLQWQLPCDNSIVDFHAPRVWLAIDVPALLDQRLRARRIKADEAILAIQPQGLADEGRRQAGSWLQLIESSLDAFGWDAMQDRFQSLITAEKIDSTWNARIEKWVMQSHSIVNSAEAIERQLIQEDNPLRSEVELNNMLDQLSALRAQQRRLLDQFDGLEKLLLAESRQLQKLLEEDHRRIDKATAESVAAIRNPLANAVIQLAAEQLWYAYKPLLETGCQLPRYALPAIPPSPGWLVRHTDAMLPVFKADKIDIAGRWRTSFADLPFRMNASFEIARFKRPSYRVTSQWNYDVDVGHTLHCLEVTSQVDLARNTFEIPHQIDRLPNNDLRLRVRPRDPSIENGSAKIELINTQSDGLASIFDLDIQSTGQNLTGEMRIRNGASTPLQAWVSKLRGSDLMQEANASDAGELGDSFPVSPQTPKDVSAVTDLTARDILMKAILDSMPADEDDITIHIAGQWEQPQFTLPEVPPTWLLEHLRRQIAGLFQQRSQHLTMQLEAELMERLQHIEHLIAHAAENGQQETLAHQEFVSNVAKKVEGRLAEITGASFADRPAVLIKR